MNSAGVTCAGARRGFIARACDQRDVQCSRSLTALATRNGVHASLVRQTTPSGALGDVQASADRRAQRLIPEPRIRDLSFLNAAQKLPRLLVGVKLLMGKI